MPPRTAPAANIPLHMEHTLPSQLHLALERFLLERRGLDLAPATMAHYAIQLGQFFSWVAVRRPDVTTMTQLDKELVVAYRVFLAERPPIKSSHAARLGPDSLQASQRALRTFFGWARDDGYAVDERILRLRKTRIPRREAMVYTLTAQPTLSSAELGRPLELPFRLPGWRRRVAPDPRPHAPGRGS